MTKQRNRLNVYDRTTGAYLCALTGDRPAKLLKKAASQYAQHCWEWDGWNRAPRKD